MDIEELREFEEDGSFGGVAGYFAQGVIPKQKFAIACNQEFDLANCDDQIVYTDHVKHGYLRKVDLKDCPGQWTIHESSNGIGAFMATYVFY